VLDDAHFRAAGVAEENLWGGYVTEDQGNRLAVFGTEMGLRYRIPFGEVEDVIAYLRQHATDAGDRVGTMGDDGEKFGAWPGTEEHCWGRGRWIERFFDALEASRGWLTMVTPSEWLERAQPVGRVYVPTSSYAEMGEWALPAAEGHAFAKALHRARDERRPEARWLRGGFWRNFQVRYREINDLHKQMLRVSSKVAAMPAAGNCRSNG
jgi:alpha-amylase